MLTAKEIEDEGEISKWLKWIFELPQGSKKEVEFRAKAIADFDEALPPDYKAATGKTYYLIYKGTLEQLLVKLNWGAQVVTTIVIAGMVRINKGQNADICLKSLLDVIRPVCKIKGKQEVWARSSSEEGQYVLENLSLLITTRYSEDGRIFRYQILE